MNLIQRIIYFFKGEPSFARTNWKKSPLSDYSIHDIYEAGTGEDYNYYMYIHPKGQVIIMRENVDETEYRYADGGRGAVNAWANRETLDYKYISRI